MLRVKASNCISRIFGFGTDEVGILLILIGMKEAKEAVLQLRPDRYRYEGECFEFIRANEIEKG